MRTSIFAAALATFATACAPPQAARGDDGGDDDGRDSSVPDGDTSGACGAQQQDIGVVNLGPPPDMLVVLDRSGSMSTPPATFPLTFTSKWSSMKSALNGTVTSYQQNIKFGLLEFPSDNDCGVDQTAEVNVALAAGSAFQTYFSRTPNGNTPADKGLAAALVYYNSIPVNPDGRYVLFATDGEPNCITGVPDDQIAAVAAQRTVAAVTALNTAGIKTFVLGFGQFAGNGVLNDAAIAGGVPNTGAKKFYEATDAAALATALQTIAGGIIQPSCDFALQSVPPDPNNVTVTINGVAVPRSPSHGNGWDYYPNDSTITFFGSYCTEVMNGASSAVNFAYGCPGPVVL